MCHGPGSLSLSPPAPSRFFCFSPSRSVSFSLSVSLSLSLSLTVFLSLSLSLSCSLSVSVSFFLSGSLWLSLDLSSYFLSCSFSLCFMFSHSHWPVYAGGGLATLLARFTFLPGDWGVLRPGDFLGCEPINPTSEAPRRKASESFSSCSTAAMTSNRFLNLRTKRKRTWKMEQNVDSNPKSVEGLQGCVGLDELVGSYRVV